MTRVLVVDDEQAMAETMAEELTARHLDVTVLSSADEAFAMLTEGRLRRRRHRPEHARA